MNRIDLLKAVAVKQDNKTKCTSNSFIGYGNPNSNILILGKECAFDPNQSSELDKIAYYNNPEAWVEYCNNPLESVLIPDWKTVPPIHEEWKKNFNPRFAFRGQVYTTKKDVAGRTSTTWFMYQKMLDMFHGITREKNDLLDFQEHCFITELSGIPMKMSRYSSIVRESIEKRVNGLFREAFFQSFPLIIAACKGYVNRYHIDLLAIFPHSRIIVTNQLSMMPRKGYLEDIAEIMKGDEPYRII